MSYSRPSIIEILENEIAILECELKDAKIEGTKKSSTIEILEREFKDSEKKDALRKTTTDILKERPGSASRIFDRDRDRFPCLLPKEKIELLTEQFKEILSEISGLSESNGVTLPYKEDQEIVFFWIKELALIGMKEILDRNGHIRIELIKLLGWESFKDQLGSKSDLTLSVLCGYISSINQDVMKNASQEIRDNDEAYLGLCGYLNFEQNTRTWVKEILNNSNYIFKSFAQKKDDDSQMDIFDNLGYIFKPFAQKNDDSSQINHILRWPSENPKTSSFMVIAAIAAASSIMFFKQQAQKPSGVELDELKHRPPEFKKTR